MPLAVAAAQTLPTSFRSIQAHFSSSLRLLLHLQHSSATYMSAAKGVGFGSKGKVSGDSLPSPERDEM
jgi:hypothetical protein